MSQIKLLLDVVSDMRHLADSLETYANAVTCNEHIACEKPVSPDEFVEIYTPEAEEPVKDAPPQKPKYTKLDVRSCLSKLNKSGYTNEVMALLRRHGAPKLSEIDESEYDAIMEEAKSIGSET